MTSHILLINCPDQSGLVHKITGVLYKHKLNVISNGEFVERTFNHFFMRTEFSGDFSREQLLKDMHASLPEGVIIKLSDNRKKDIIILATKEHHCLGDLLIRHAFNELQANILCVISNHKTLKELTQKFDIPFYFIDHENKNREDHENEILKTIEKFNPEFLVLAKYMRILSPGIVTRYANRIINIHHSFLPAFAGANPYAQAY